MPPAPETLLVTPVVAVSMLAHVLAHTGGQERELDLSSGLDIGLRYFQTQLSLSITQAGLASHCGAWGLCPTWQEFTLVRVFLSSLSPVSGFLSLSH